MGAKQTRREAIRQVVRAQRPATQAELVRLLKKAGHDVTQTTISRDLADMNLRKAPDGRYELAEDLHLKRMCADLVQSVEGSANLVVVKTFAGTAEGVGAALDDVGRDGVLGCVAGDDTLLVITRDEGSARDVVELIRAYSGKDT
jgi:transcriptional regulator of arginine metabolism